jgi:signal transduction histidine kinase
VRWLLNRAQRFPAPDGQGSRVAGVIIDITDRKQAEAERERLEQQLRQAQKLEAIGTLAGGIAHDFNNILSAILGYGELAQKGTPEGTPLRRHIDASIAAGQRAKSLVERILAFSRSGVGERVPVQGHSTRWRRPCPRGCGWSAGWRRAPPACSATRRRSTRWS